MAARPPDDDRSARLSAALAFARAAAWEYDPTTRRILWKENADRIFGLPPGGLGDDLQGLVELVHPRDREKYVAAMEAVADRAARGETGSGELPDFRVVWPDGSVRWLHVSSQITPDGTLEGLAVDVTEQRRAEEEAHRRQERFVSLVRASPDAIIIVDRSGRVSFASDAAAAMFGLPVDSFVGRLGAELINELTIEEVQRSQDRFQGILAGAMTSLRDQVWYRRADDGRPFLAEYHTRILRDADGAADGFVSILRDVTDRVRTHERLLEAQQRAEVSERAKSELLARASHELRTPLNAILGFSQLLEVEELAPGVRSSVEYIARAGRDLLKLVDEILDLSQLSSGRAELRPEPLDVAVCVREALAATRAEARTRGVRVTTSAPGRAAVVLADRARLKQVLTTLLEHVVTHTRGPGDVEVRWASQDTVVRLDLRDPATALTPDELRRAFEPFERLPTGGEDAAGSGVGLVLVRGIVEAMDGRIEVASTPPQGTVFSITLPAAATVDRAAADATPDVVPVAAVPPTAALVVYVDDDAANRMLVRRVVERLPGASLLTASDARSGLDLVRGQRPDVLLLDVRLPDRDGEALLADLRRDPVTRELPVIVLSSDVAAATERRLRAAGADHYLTKPLDLGQLRDLITTTLPDLRQDEATG